MTDTPRIGPITGPDFSINMLGTGCNNGTPINYLSEGQISNSNGDQATTPDGVYRAWTWYTGFNINTGGYTIDPSPVPTIGIRVPTTGWYNVKAQVDGATVTVGIPPSFWIEIRVNGIAVKQNPVMIGPNPLASWFIQPWIFGNNIFCNANDLISIYTANINTNGIAGRANVYTIFDVTLVSV